MPMGIVVADGFRSEQHSYHSYSFESSTNADKQHHH